MTDRDLVELRRATRCGLPRPGYLTDPGAAAELATGCDDCGAPWWAHRDPLDRLPEPENRPLAVARPLPGRMTRLAGLARSWGVLGVSPPRMPQEPRPPRGGTNRHP